MFVTRIILRKSLSQRCTSAARFLNTAHNTNADEKPNADRKEQTLFTNAALNYDKINDFAFLGMHRIWRRKFIDRLGPTNNTKLIDMAGGTGAITIRFLEYVKDHNLKNCHVTVCDINEQMLDICKTKATNYDPSLITLVTADGENAPFENDSFNAYTICYGLRCCPNREKVLKEAYRILQPGGKFLCLETSNANSKLAQRFYDMYGSYVLPVMGRMLGQQPIFDYLVESTKEFPDKETIKTMIEEAGFQQVTYESLGFGIMAIHSGIKA
jgi:2-methoxy-6-polyprenyl-1,4-benzoquinol methylase